MYDHYYYRHGSSYYIIYYIYKQNLKVYRKHAFYNLKPEPGIASFEKQMQSPKHRNLT